MSIRSVFWTRLSSKRTEYLINYGGPSTAVRVPQSNQILVVDVLEKRLAMLGVQLGSIIDIKHQAHSLEFAFDSRAATDLTALTERTALVVVATPPICESEANSADVSTAGVSQMLCFRTTKERLLSLSPLFRVSLATRPKRFGCFCLLSTVECANDRHFAN